MICDRCTDIHKAQREGKTQKECECSCHIGYSTGTSTFTLTGGNTSDIGTSATTANINLTACDCTGDVDVY